MIAQLDHNQQQNQSDLFESNAIRDALLKFNSHLAH